MNHLLIIYFHAFCYFLKMNVLLSPLSSLIEGITGEQAIYRRRTEPQPDIPNIQQKPKRLKLVVDVSASMYR